MIAFETSVAVHGPLEDVFAYVSDPRNVPDWNSAVQAMLPTAPGSSTVGSTYSMQRRLPSGPATNQLEIVAPQTATRVRHPRDSRADAVSLPLPIRCAERRDLSPP
jgi:hypothetical protein